MHWSDLESLKRQSETQQTQKKNSDTEEHKLMKNLKKIISNLTKS